jgi:hypothetical protein
VARPREHQGALAGVWSAWAKLFLFKPEKYMGTRYRSVLELDGFQCGKGLMAQLQYTDYSLGDGRGDVVASGTPFPAWGYPTPDSVGEMLLESVCKVAAEPERKAANQP